MRFRHDGELIMEYSELLLWVLITLISFFAGYNAGEGR